MSKLFTVKNLALAAVIALSLGVFATAAHAFVNIPWSLLPSDPFCPHRPGCHEQQHKVNLVAGVTYVIGVVPGIVERFGPDGQSLPNLQLSYALTCAAVGGGTLYCSRRDAADPSMIDAVAVGD